MKCPHCQAGNPDAARFCMNCGKPMTLACRQCGTELPPAARFCFQCGQAVGQPEPATPAVAAPAGIQATRQFMPSELVAQLEAARTSRAMEGERRIVTILFSDVKGSTAMAEQLDPEEWTEIMNQAFEHLIRPVYRYEGTIARLMGDAILAFFGAPLAHENDPQRAVLAGLEIISGIQPFREEIRRRTGMDFNVRVGINTGLVVVGAVGSDLRMEYTAMGDAINLAARMEQTAQAGTVQIAEETYKLVAPLFQVEALGNIEVKGKRETVRAYRVLGRKTVAGQVRGIEGVATPLIGRTSEFRALQEATAFTRQGSGRILWLLGEAGLGKSRLIAELRQVATAAGSSLAWYETNGLSHETSHPYWLFRQLLRRFCGILPNEPDEIIRRKLEASLETVAAEQREPMHQVFGTLLAIESEPARLIEGEAFKRQLFELMPVLWRQRAAASATVLVFDDLHWVDAASAELLSHLFRLVDEAPLLFLCAMRPDRSGAGWKVKQAAETEYPHRYTALTLSPLSADESSALVDSLLAISELPAQVRQLILEKAEGNPFFVEEVVRTLIENGILVRDESGRHWRATMPVEHITIPNSLHALLMARIDRLEEDARYTLQLAAVIGRSFYYRVLDLLTGMGDRLDQQLSDLQRAELIREAERVPELEYIFRHALTQEAAYNTILIKQRRHFHRRVGEVMESLFADRLEEFASLLGYHFYEAGDERAARYYTLAGDAAMRVFANVEAADYYRLALQFAQQEEGDSQQLRHLYTRRGRALEINSEYVQALANYEEMMAVARRRDDKALELAALLGQATIRGTFNVAMNTAEALRLSQEALALAHSLGDREAEARVHWILLLAGAINGLDPNQLIHYGEAALALARELQLRELAAFVLHDLWLAYGGADQWQRAGEALEEARRLWLELNNLPMLAATLCRIYMVHIFTGAYEQAVACSDEAWLISRQSRDLESQAFSRFQIGLVYWQQGEPGTAVARMEEAIALGTPINTVNVVIASRVDLAWMLALLGAPERGMALALEAQAKVDELQVSFLQPMTVGVIARLHLRLGEVAQAAERLAELGTEAKTQGVIGFYPPVAVMPRLACAELARAQQAYAQATTIVDELIRQLRAVEGRHYLPEALLLKGQLLLDQARFEAARAALQQAQAEATVLGAKGALWPVLMRLSELERQQGNADQALAIQQQAAGIVATIAENIPDPELRQSFISLPDVRQLLHAWSKLEGRK